MENFYQKLENAHNLEFISREIFENELKENNLNYKFTEGRFDCYDCEIYNSDKTYYVELKYRPKYTSTDFDSIMVEDIKFYNHQYIAKACGAKPIYVVIFNDGYYYMCNLNKIKPEWKPKLLNEKSCSDYGANVLKYKNIYNIPLNNFTKYQYNANYILTEKEKEVIKQKFG